MDTKAQKLFDIVEKRLALIIERMDFQQAQLDELRAVLVGVTKIVLGHSDSDSEEATEATEATESS